MVNIIYCIFPGAELREIQRQIDGLSHPTSPRTVAEFMTLRRDVMFLEFDTAVRHCMADTFLSTGNVQAYKVQCCTIVILLLTLQNNTNNLGPSFKMAVVFF